MSHTLNDVSVPSDLMTVPLFVRQRILVSCLCSSVYLDHLLINLSDLLGVNPNAGDAEIKKAYRKQALAHHPDKGGDPEAFKDLTLA